MEKVTLDTAIRTTQSSIGLLERMSTGYKLLRNFGKYGELERAEDDLKVVLAVLKGYREDVEKGKPQGAARAALQEACASAAVDLKKLNLGLSGAYETLPERLKLE